ncbi:MAG TPA: tetratricopeptide repeat protein, partial [Vicinamibacterales bacterium]|nr:tetratricopeptide repeat protein [Vicinamibacterales bacterium]
AVTTRTNWTEGWQLGKPDLVVTLGEPYQLKAEGTDVFRIFVMSLPVQTTRFVRALEFRPGNPKVVHHANIRIDRTPASRKLDEADPAPGYEGLISRTAQYPDGHFLGWTPGQVSPLLPKDMAWRLEPGTDLVAELHMQPDGKPERVQPSIGLFFGDVPPTRTPTMLRLGRQGIDIPAGEKEYVVTDSYLLPVDVEVEAVQPHAHYRAHTVHGEATLPDGTKRSLIDIADWDFRWQHVYRFVTPFSLPKGSTIAMRYVYDNSDENPRNPERPPKRTLWGQRSADEMGDLWVQVLTRDDHDLAVLERGFRPKVAAEDVIGYEVEIGKHPADVGLHDDAALLYLELGRADDAVKHFQASLQLKSESAAAHYNLGIALTAARRLRDAAAEYQRALQVDPNYVKAHNNLGSVYVAQGRFDDAVREYREVVRLEPDGASGVANLAWPLATAPSRTPSDVTEAVGLATRAAELTRRRDPGVLDVLAAAYAAAGQFEKAVDTTDAALRLTPPEPLASGIRSRQALYRQHTTYVATASAPR